MEDIKVIIETLQFSNVFWQILTPILFSIADIITGFVQAVINNNIDTTKMRTGLWHKFLIVLVLCLSILLDITFNLHFCSKSVSIYIIVMELLSICENLTKSGIKMGKLSDMLQISEGDEKNETK